MIKKILFTMIIATLLILCGCIENTKDENNNNNKSSDINGDNLDNNTSDNQTNPEFDYVNNNYNYGINMPDNWNIGGDISYGIKLSSQRNNSSVSLIITNPDTMPQNSTLKNFSDYLIESLNKTSGIDNLTVLNEEETTINQKQAYIINYCYNMSGFRLRSKHVYVLYNNDVFSLIYSSSLDIYNTYINEIDEIINSFTIIK